MTIWGNNGLKGLHHIAQGNALGNGYAANTPCKGKSAFALTGRLPHLPVTQGVALGYMLVGLSGRCPGLCGIGLSGRWQDMNNKGQIAYGTIVE